MESGKGLRGSNKEILSREEDAGPVSQPAAQLSTLPSAAREQVELWVEEFGDYLIRFARAHVRDEDLATDLVQDTLLSACRAYASFQGNASPRTWLTVILRNKIRDYARKKKEVTESSRSSPGDSQQFSIGSLLAVRTGNSWSDSPEETARQSQFSQVLNLCLAKLTDVSRTAFLMREVEELELSHIASELEITQGNLRVILFRARAALRSCLGENWFGETTKE